MATQNHVTKHPITTGNAVRKAGTAQADDAAKLAKKVEDQEAQQLAQAEQAGAVQEVSAMTVAQAEAAGVAAAEGSIGAVSAEAAAGAAAEAGAAGAAGAGAAGAAAGAAAVSPAVIGAAALGVVAVAAAAGGGSSGGGSSSPSNNGLATDKPGNSSNNSNNAGNNGNSNDNGNNAANNGGTTDKPAEDSKPADQSKPIDQSKPAEDLKPAEDHKPTDQSKPVDQPKPGDQPKPADQPKLVEGPAESELKDGQPLIAESGETRLSNLADVFAKASGNDAKPAEFIRITSIKAAEGAIPDGEYGPRFTWDETVEKAPATAGKDVTDTTVVDNTQTNNAATTTIVTHAYEVIDAGKPVTYKEAQELAQKAGGKLLTIDSSKEAEWLGSNLWGSLGEYDGSKALEGKTGTEKEAIEAKMAGQLAKNGAWLGSDATNPAADGKPVVNAIIRKGGEEEKGIKTYHAEGAEPKLQHFVVEYDNYKAPLTLNGKEVVEGSTILKEDFGKLVWNSSQNKGGILTYQAVQSAEANAPVVEGSQPHTLKLTESSTITHPMVSPEPPKASDNTNTDNDQTVKPVYPESKNQSANVDHDKVDAALNKSLFTGTDPDKHPAFIKITGINEAGDTKDESALYLRKVDASEVVTDKHYGDPKNDPFIVAYEDFDKLKWDSAQNTGGTFKFQALDANKQPIGDEQTVTINEAPAKEVLPPSSDVPPKGDGTQTPANPGNGQKPGDTTAEDPKKQPGTSEEQNQGNSGSGNGASENQNQGGNASGQGSNASGQTGGTSGQNGNNQNQSSNAPGQNEQQTPEKTAASEDKIGDYPQNPEPFKVGHDAESTSFNKAVFGGSEGKEPPAVKILHVKGSGEGDVEGLFKLVNGKPVAVEPNAVIEQADFDKLVWNAQKGDGTHTITFVPVKADGTPLARATEHTVTVQEAAAAPTTQEPPQQGAAEPKIGVYGDATTINLTHDQAAEKINASVFKGTDPSKEPAAVKIISVEQQNFGNGNAWEPVGGTTKPAFGKSEQYDDNLGAGRVLLNADFDKAQWNAAFDNGSGNYRVVFKPADANGKVIESAKEQTLYIHEAADKPAYPAQLEVQNVATNNGDVHVNQALFKGNEKANEPMYVRITSIAETDGDSAEHSVLFLKNGEKVTHEFKAGDATPTGTLILSVEQMGQLHWDAAHNNGGTFKFKPLGGDGKDIEGAEEQTVTVTEAPAPATSGTPSSDSTNSGVQETGDTTGSGGSATEPPPGGTPSKPVIQNEGNPSSDDPSTTAAPGKDPAGTKQADADATTEGAKPRSISAKSLFSSPGHESATDSYDVASLEPSTKLIDQLHHELTQG